MGVLTITSAALITRKHQQCLWKKGHNFNHLIFLLSRLLVWSGDILNSSKRHRKKWQAQSSQGKMTKESLRKQHMNCWFNRKVMFPCFLSPFCISGKSWTTCVSTLQALTACFLLLTLGVFHNPNLTWLQSEYIWSVWSSCRPLCNRCKDVAVTHWIGTD